MKCPYCDDEMTKGYIYGDRYSMKWLPAEKKLLFGILAKGGIELGEFNWLERPKIETHMCHKCNKLIIDMNKD